MKLRKMMFNFVYFDGAVEEHGNITTEPSIDSEKIRGFGPDIGRLLAVIMGIRLGQGGPSGLPVGWPDDVKEPDGTLCKRIFLAESIYKET